MRLGVLDIGSNTAHLLVVDAYGGAAPMPAYSHKELLRLAETFDTRGAISEAGIASLTRFVGSALAAADAQGCEEILGFATSAVRDATNSEDVLRRVREETGAEITVLAGEDEARLTFLAVRRWFGWSSGRLIVFDIGGGSLEIACGPDEAPEVAQSLPLGAGRLAREWLPGDQPDDAAVQRLRAVVRARIARDAEAVVRGGAPDRAVGTSKTLRSLARICGAAPSANGLLVPRTLSAGALPGTIARLQAMTPAERAGLPGVSVSRAHQLLAGAVVAEAMLDVFGLPALEICPWALREGILLERLDQLSVLGTPAVLSGLAREVGP